MRLTTQEREFIIRLVAHELEALKKEASVIKDYPDVKLLIGEKRYEAFLADLNKKLSHPQ